MRINRHVFIGLLAAGLTLVSDAGAQIRYSVRLQSRKSSVAVPSDPLMAMLGKVLLEYTVPDGSLDMTCVVGAAGARIEWNKALSGIPAGAVVLRSRDGNTVVLNPADKTYWRLTLITTALLPANWKPEFTRSAPGDSATLLGMRVPRSSVEIRIPIPVASTGALASGMPTDLYMSGEVWTTDRYKAHLTPISRAIAGLPILGLDTMEDGHFVLRQILRGPMLGDVEIETLVTAISEESVSEELFQVPSDYRQIPPP